MEETLKLILQEMREVRNDIKNLDTKLDNVASELKNEIRGTNGQFHFFESRENVESVTKKIVELETDVKLIKRIVTNQ